MTVQNHTICPRRPVRSMVYIWEITERQLAGLPHGILTPCRSDRSPPLREPYDVILVGAVAGRVYHYHPDCHRQPEAPGLE